MQSGGVEAGAAGLMGFTRRREGAKARRFSNAVRAELVKAPFFLARQKKERPCDKLRANGVWCSSRLRVRLFLAPAPQDDIDRPRATVADMRGAQRDHPVGVRRGGEPVGERGADRAARTRFPAIGRAS